MRFDKLNVLVEETLMSSTSVNNYPFDNGNFEYSGNFITITFAQEENYMVKIFPLDKVKGIKFKPEPPLLKQPL